MGAPELIAHFRIAEKLGQGGMGVVYRAHDEKLGRDVALKVLRAEAVGDEHARRRLLREARAAAAITHPNVATVYEVGEADGRVYIAMELAQGETLRDRMRTRRLGVLGAARIARDIARGLARAHEAGVVHRDLKPDNVIVAPDGGLKILDFGLAKKREERPENDGTLTEEGYFLGTPAYAAPEQASGSAPVDARADVFAFGVMLFEMLDGERPFGGKTTSERLASVLRDEPRPLGASIPRAIAAIVERCLEKDPKARFTDGAALVAALESALDSEKDVATSDGSAEQLASVEGVEKTTPEPRRVFGGRVSPLEAVRFQLKVRPMFFVAASVVIVLALVGGVIGFRQARRTGHGSGEPGGMAGTPMPSCSPDAIAEYRAGLVEQHAVSWTAAEQHFRVAAERDPECAEAHLRRAIVAAVWTPVQARDAYQHARARRTRLSDRDRALLDAYEPTLARDPADEAATRERLLALAERRTDDAEILVLASMVAIDPDKSSELARRALGIDESYGDAWLSLANAADKRGDEAAMREAIDGCLRAVPSSLDCAVDRMWLARRTGDCALVAQTMRGSVARSTTMTWTRPLWASALVTSGAARDVATAVLAPAWATSPPESAYEAPLERGLLAVAYGDFDRAEAELGELGRAVEGRADLGPHVAYGLFAVDMKLEKSDAAGAAKIATEHLQRLDVWTTPPHVGRSAWGVRQFVPALLAAAPDVPAAERETRLAAWRVWVASTHTDPLTIWAYGDATFATSKGLAQSALARMPPPPALPSRYAGVDLLVGRTLLLADRPADAVAHLRAATRRCDGAEQPFEQMHARLLLARALEPTDHAESCRMYGSIASRWPKWTVTAAEARSRGCP